jgi:hypothetical protein
MVQVHFEAVTQAKSRITLNDLPEHALHHTRFKLVTASETNAHHLILDILSVPNS